MSEEAETTRRFVAFWLDEQLYGFSIDQVREILQMVEITPIPDAPAHVRGAINVRGTVVPILDLRMLLGLQERPFDASTPIVLVEGGERLVGVGVDDVADVLQVSAEQCDAASGEYPMMAQVCRLDERMLLVLDPGKLAGGVPDLQDGEGE